MSIFPIVQKATISYIVMPGTTGPKLTKFLPDVETLTALLMRTAIFQ